MIGEFQIADLYHPPGAAKMIKQLIYSEKFGSAGQIQQHETELTPKSGQAIPIQLSATLLKQDGVEVGSIGFFHDMSAQKEFEHALKALSITDSLTSLYNQRHFHTVLSQEVARSVRHGRPLSLLCIDMDNFKGINDNLGHLEGDNLLRFVGELITSVARNNDHGFRYGGDEFMLLLPETETSKALLLAQRLVEQYEHKQPPLLRDYNQSDSSVSLSIGVSQLKPNEHPELFVKRADLAMYQSKKSGGSQIEFAP